MSVVAHIMKNHRVPTQRRLVGNASHLKSGWVFLSGRVD